LGSMPRERERKGGREGGLRSGKQGRGEKGGGGGRGEGGAGGGACLKGRLVCVGL